MSIRAMNWAMEQATGDPRSQCLLYVIADCANPEGMAFPSIKFMAEKSQQSKATVQRRLKELEDIGALARFPRWEDEDGKVNADGRGRRTSDEIRLLLDVRIDRSPSSENADHDGSESSTPPVSASDPPLSASNPPVAQLSDGGPSHCGDPLMNLKKEPREDSPPNPPPGGGHEADRDVSGREAAKQASWSRFERAWQEPILHQERARTLWWAFTEAEEERAIKAGIGYVVWRRKQPKPPNVINAHRFLGEVDAWPGFAALAPPENTTPAQPRFVGEHEPEFTARRVLDRLRGIEPRVAKGYPEHGSGIMVAPLAPNGPDLLALAQFDDADWVTIERATHRQQVAAWDERIKQWCGRDFCLNVARIRTDVVLHTMSDGTKVFGSRDVHHVPCEWPPRKDGTLSTAPPVSEE